MYSTNYTIRPRLKTHINQLLDSATTQNALEFVYLLLFTFASSSYNITEFVFDVVFKPIQAS